MWKLELEISEFANIVRTNGETVLNNNGRKLIDLKIWK
jgi:hypothetical protein